MNKKLVLAEKPSVARDIASILNCHKKGNGFLEGEKYIITWALGHLVTLADPESYDEKYKTWKLEDLPMLPRSLRLTVIKKSGKQFSIVKSLLNRNDIQEVIIATDAGREGELVARWILDKARVNKPLKRLWISSVTEKAIKNGFSNLKDGKEFENLYQSAVARSEADWYVGINATRALTCKHNAQLSCGRVQTPTLAIIANRETEIRNFKPQSFYGITLEANGLKFTWQESISKNSKTFSKEKCERIIESIKKEEGVITEIEKKLKKNFAPQLYDLTELQKDAHKLWGFSAKETLSIMQRLYEQHKLVTYPRTDSKYLSTDIVETLKDRIQACSISPYKRIAAKLLNQPIRANKSFVDNDKVSDHHAIIPTEEPPVLNKLNDREFKIYDLIIKRFLAVLYPAFEYEQTTIKMKLVGELFVVKGKRTVKQGWKEIYDLHDENPADSILDSRVAEMKEGDKLQISSILLTNGETTPPSRFNEGTLLSAMEKPMSFMNGENKELIKTIGETGGLGTVATRADIIEKLFHTFLIEKSGKEIIITSKGKQLLDLVPEELKSPSLTAEWEQKLEAIAKGKLNKQAFTDEMKAYAKTVVNEIKNGKLKFKHDNVTGTKCPDCGKLMLEVKNKKGKLLVCQDRECGHRKGISKVTNARCPNCRKKLELRGQGEGQMFICKCGHREKLSTFNERRKKEKNTKVSKKDVSKYLKKNNQQEPINTALADALAKLNLDRK